MCWQLLAHLTLSTNSASFFRTELDVGSCESLVRSSSSDSELTAMRPCLRRLSFAVTHSVKRIEPYSDPIECDRFLSFSASRCS